MSDPDVDTATSASLFNWTQAIYGLHAFSLLTGILGAATVIGAFLTGWPSLIAVILNYIKRADVRHVAPVALPLADSPADVHLLSAQPAFLPTSAAI